MQYRKNKAFSLIWKGFMLALLICFGTAAAESANYTDVTARMSVNQGIAEIAVKAVRGEYWLFLPAFAQDNQQIRLFAYDGSELTWEVAESEEYKQVWHVKAGGEELFELHVMRSANLRSFFIFSDDPEEKGIQYIEGGVGHSRETTGDIGIVDAQGNVDYVGRLRQLRGRGNGTWAHAKKAYQIKLEEKADLLKTGDPDEVNRTWILLADATDHSHLHNRISLDLALELGMEQTSRSEFVDLYYDGDYRGTYLLTEKVQIKDGRIDVTDYEELLKAWNESVGQSDLTQLPVVEDVNRFDNLFTYIDGVKTAGGPDAGSYQIELETGSSDERCFFRLNDESNLYYAIKNPENASREMMIYVSERLQEAQQTVRNGGIHPETGRTLEEDFNVDAFARLALVAEFTYNLDSFSYASTWFVLPAGETRFEPGPIWDADLSLRYRKDGTNAAGVGLKENSGWMTDFYSCESFARAVQAIYRDEMYPLLKNVLLGDQQGVYLKSLDQYISEMEASVRMNRMFWDGAPDSRLEYATEYEDEIFLLRQFMEERSEWLHQVLVEHDVWDTEYLELEFKAVFGHPEELIIQAFPWTRVEITYDAEQISEADDMDYAWWYADVYLTPLDGKAFKAPVLTVNGGEIAYEILEDGTLHFAVEYEDYSYRTAYYGDIDIGLVYNYDIYMEDYPEVAEECMYDEELMMEYFCTTGMMERHVGNGLFSPMDVAHEVPESGAECTEWPDFYWALLDHGYEDGWLLKVGKTFLPELTDAL